MSRSVRARRDARGFSFVELLITIIIAGIAFAAMVPLFVQAQSKGAGDTARNVALNLAQDRIEKIRQLDYDLITEANLKDASFQASTSGEAQFGSVEKVQGGKGSKDYTLTYSVVFVGGTKDGMHAISATTGDRTENFKQVTVDAYWTGNPKPVKHAVLQTYVYRQYGGSYINSLVIAPVAAIAGGTQIDPKDPTRQFVTSYSISLTAYLNAADAQNTEEVTFWVYSSSGQELAELSRKTTEVTTAGVYTWTYPIAGSPGSQDGVYTFKAKAVSKYGYPGNTAECVYPIETGKPPSSQILSALPGDGRVTLSWTQSPASDIVSYRIDRREASGPTAQTTIPCDANQSPTYVDQTVTVGKQYYYTVRAVDSVGKTSDSSIEVPVIPAANPVDVPPYSPTNVTAVASLTSWPPQIDLQWDASVTDLPLPTVNSAIDHYNIYRSDNGGANYTAWLTPKTVPLVVDQLSYTYGDGDGLAASTTYFYRIAAVNKAGQESSPYMVCSATTRGAIRYNLRVENLNTTTGAKIKVTDNAGTLINVAAANPSNPSNPITVQNQAVNTTSWWVSWNLPPGSYRVWWNISGLAWTQQDGSLSSADRIIPFGP